MTSLSTLKNKSPETSEDERGGGVLVMLVTTTYVGMCR